MLQISRDGVFSGVIVETAKIILNFFVRVCDSCPLFCPNYAEKNKFNPELETLENLV